MSDPVPYGAPLHHKPLMCQKPLFCKGFGNSTATFFCYVAGMGEMAKFPYLTGRKGSCNLYYKREVPPELRAKGRPSQVWRSLGTSDRKRAEGAYGAKHAEVEALFAQWRQDDAQPVGPIRSQLPVDGAPNFVPLTPALLRRLADAHYLNVYEDDFQWRGDLWKKVHEDEEAFWRGEIIKLPDDDWHERGGNQYSYFALLMEEPVLEDVFLYAIFRARKKKLQQLRRRYQLGDSRDQGPIADGLLRSKEISFSDADRSRFMRKLMNVEVKALEDLTSGDEVIFDGIVSREAAAESPIQSGCSTSPPPAYQSVHRLHLLDDRAEPTAGEERPPLPMRRSLGSGGNCERKENGRRFDRVRAILASQLHAARNRASSELRPLQREIREPPVGDYVDPEPLQLTRDANGNPLVRVDVTKDQLKSQPEWKWEPATGK